MPAARLRSAALAAALLMPLSAAVAGTNPSGQFYSSVPGGGVNLQPGQIYTVTLTANVQNVSGVVLVDLPALTGDSQFEIVPGGTCATGVLYPEGATCTVQVRYIGSAPPAGPGILQGRCRVTQAMVGFSITCSIKPAGPLGELGRFFGVGVLDRAVNTLGPLGLSSLALAMLTLGALAALRRKPALK